MKKQFMHVAVMMLVMLSILRLPVNADPAPKHYKALREVLFGDARVSDTDKLDSLNDACQLAIDQHNGDGKDTLDELKQTIRGLPDTIDSFNVNHGSLHRNYTHRGWDYEYEKDEAHWKDIRKKIILDTVNQLFDFGVLSKITMLGYDDKCNSFSAFIYYIHILHDHRTNNEFHSNYYEIPLVKGRGDKYGIVEEIEKHCKILFADYDDTKEYRKLIMDLEYHKKSIQKIYSSRSDLADSENYEKYRLAAENLMKTLVDDIPVLMKKEKFFSKAFKL